MSDEVAITPPTGYVTFKRMVQLSPYNTATAEIMLQIPTSDQWVSEDGSVDVERITADAKPAFFAAKATVYEQLGIQFEVTDEIVVMEILHQQLGGVEVTASEAKALTETTSTARQADTRPSDGTPDAPSTKEGLWRELSEHPERYYDNRKGKKNPKGPDFKRKSGEGALWLEYKGESQVPDGVTLPPLAA